MSNSLNLRKIRNTFLIIVALGLSAVMGLKIGDAYGKWNRDEQRRSLDQSTTNKLSTIGIGDTLPDHIFEDLNRRPVVLSEVITGMTLVVFMKAGCPSCEYELSNLSSTIKDDKQWSKFVLISPDNPRWMEELRNEYNIKAPMLYDHMAEYWSILKVTAYPMNVTVDSNRVIKDIIVGEIGNHEFSQFLTLD